MRTLVLFVPVRGGGRIVMEVHNEWVEVLVLFDVDNRNHGRGSNKFPWTRKGKRE